MKTIVGMSEGHSCGCCTSRRRFLAGCAGLASCAALGGLASAARPARADAGATARPKVRLVFAQTSADKPIWPNIGYDFEARNQRLVDLLARECKEVEFLPARLMDDPKQADEVLAGDAEVGGYLVCLQGLGWRNDVPKLCSTGKPTLIVDNLFGGSGKFLTALPAIMASGKPVDWVSSSRDGDIAAAARQFAQLRKGAAPAEIAAAFRDTRRARTPGDRGSRCAKDPLPAADLEAGLRKLRGQKLLVVGGGRGGDAFRKAAQEITGVEFVPVEFAELAQAHAQADREAAAQLAAAWRKRAQKVVEPDAAELENSAALYAAMKSLLDRHGARGITINCLGGFYGGHLKAYPCLGFAQLNDDGLVGGCEADQMSALTMLAGATLFGRPGFISDPVIDTSRNVIVYAHCVAMTKPFGPDGQANPFRIRSHSEDRKGASIQSLLPAGYLTTTLELNPATRQVLLHQARSTGNDASDMACRTKLEAEVKGDIEKLTEQWRMGWHRVTFYGDLKPGVVELCKRLDLTLIEEA